jgi:hypothetical protein
MAESLFHFEIRKEAESGPIELLVFGNGKKPGLELAIDVDDRSIRYISFFVQDETISVDRLHAKIDFVAENVIIEKSTERALEFFKEFDVDYSDDTIIVLEKGVDVPLSAYGLDDDNFVLFSGDEFVGVLMSNCAKTETTRLNPPDATRARQLWVSANATKHLGENVLGTGGGTDSDVDARSKKELESFTTALNEAMRAYVKLPPGNHFGIYEYWEIGVNTEVGVVYHARKPGPIALRRT